MRVVFSWRQGRRRGKDGRLIFMHLQCWEVLSFLTNQRQRCIKCRVLRAQDLYTTLALNCEQGQRLPALEVYKEAISQGRAGVWGSGPPVRQRSWRQQMGLCPEPVRERSFQIISAGQERGKGRVGIISEDIWKIPKESAKSQKIRMSENGAWV